MTTNEKLTFQVDTIIFAKDGFHIIATTNGDKVSGKFNAQVGYCYTAEGVWDRTSPSALRYGPTFKLETAQQVRMTSARELGRYLTIQFKGQGLGEIFFASLVDACLADNLDLERLLDTHDTDTLIDCVGKRNAKKVQKLLDEWPRLKPQADLISPLLSYGLSEAQSLSMVHLYGKKAVEMVENHPYELINILDGVSFLRADRIAMKVGRIGYQDSIRLRAAFATGMREATANGDLGVRRKELLRKTRLLVNDVVTVNGRRVLDESVPPKVPDALLEGMLDKMLEGKLVDEFGEPCKFSSRLVQEPDEKGEAVIWYRPLLRAENRIVTALQRFKAPARPDLVDQVEALVAKAGVTLAPEQLEAIKMVFSHPVSIITGGPGCGKSFILKMILEVFDSVAIKGDMAAPTGKAAKRITESTGRFAQTLHSLIGFAPNGECAYDQTNPLASDYLVLDECSMVDTELMAATLNAVKPTCRIILVGDVDQLPSVGPGQVLRDMIRSEVIPVTRLTKGFRFSGGIASAAQAINRGELPESTDDGQFEFVETDTPIEALDEYLKNLLASGVPLEAIQVLSPTNRGNAGCEAINARIQSRVNPEAYRKETTKQKLKRDSGDILVGDRVIQVKNDTSIGLVNGDLGWVDDIRSDTGEVTLSLPDRARPLQLQSMQAQHLKLAYAITIHKSQGAEAPYVLIAVDSAAAFMLRRSLVYTGVTRGSQKVVIFASRNTLQRAVRIGEPPEGSRRTQLCSKLKAALPAVRSASAASTPPKAVPAMASAMLFDDGPELDWGI